MSAARSLGAWLPGWACRRDLPVQVAALALLAGGPALGSALRPYPVLAAVLLVAAVVTGGRLVRRHLRTPACAVPGPASPATEGAQQRGGA